MTLWTELDRATTAAGDEILLRRRGSIHEILFNGIDLMSNLTWRSEALLAERSLRRRGISGPRVLIGGLGMGFTLRAALDMLDASAQLVVCELIPAIANWNRSLLAPLADFPLEDPRVELQITDVMALLEHSQDTFDVILMDTDNGPDLTVRAENDALYLRRGLQALRRALRPNGVAAFWSAGISESFEERLTAEGWSWTREDVLLPGGRADAFHRIYLALHPQSEALADFGHPALSMT